MDANDRALLVLFGCALPVLPWLVIPLHDRVRIVWRDATEAIAWAFLAHTLTRTGYRAEEA